RSGRARVHRAAGSIVRVLSRAGAVAARAGRAPAQGDEGRVHVPAVRRLHAFDAADPRLDADGDPRARVQPQGAAQHVATRVLPPPGQRAPLDAAELSHARLLLAHRPPLSPGAGDAARGAPAAALGEARRGLGDRLESRSQRRAPRARLARPDRVCYNEGVRGRVAAFVLPFFAALAVAGTPVLPAAAEAAIERAPALGGEAERTPAVAAQQAVPQLRAARESGARPGFWKLPPH